MTAASFDAVVVGGGLAGRTAAVAIAQTGLHTLHLAPVGPPDRRTSALMGPSVAYLQQLGVIGDPPAFGEPLRQIRIIDATQRLLRAPETLFDSADAGLEAFGWNFANVALAARLDATAATLPTLTTRAEAAEQVVIADGGGHLRLTGGDTVAAPLVVGADGRRSSVRAAAGITMREHAFAQAALVCDLELSRPLVGQSVEFHYDNGPFTLVPAGDRRANLVWIDKRGVLEAAKADTATLAATLAARAQQLFGAVTLASPAFIFPLSTLAVDRAGNRGAVLIGEAAHAFPPIGAQGLNLGLRDVADLSAVLAETDRSAAGWATAASAAYAARRTSDLLRTGTVVDTLFRSLLTEMLPAQALRAGGLWALKLLPQLRRQAFAVGMGAR